MYLITMIRPFHLTNLFYPSLTFTFRRQMRAAAGKARANLCVSSEHTLAWHHTGSEENRNCMSDLILSILKYLTPTECLGAAMQVMLGVRQWTNNHRYKKRGNGNCFLIVQFWIYPFQMPMTVGKSQDHRLQK